MQKVKWTEADVINKNRIRALNNSIFSWMDGNILHSGLLEEMSNFEFKLYGFYCLAGDNLYGLSCFGLGYISKILKMARRNVILTRKRLAEKDLVAFRNRALVNSKGLRYERTIVQVLSLPIDKIVITRRKKTRKEPTAIELGLQKYGLTKGYGKFLSEPEQDRLIVEIMRDLDLRPEVQETIKAGLRRGKIRVEKRKKSQTSF